MPEALQWTPELIQTFWDGIETSGISEEMSFAKLAGESLTEFILPWAKSDWNCLDYGGGSGHLIQRLTAAGLQMAGYEPSPERAAMIEERIGSQNGFLGVIGETSSEQYDLLICTEVIEHIREEDMDVFLTALRDRVKIGGRVMLTTPHREILSEARVYCPVSNYTFHRWQHQRSWKVSEVVELFQELGFCEEWAGAVGFDQVAAVREFNLRRKLRQSWPWIVTYPDGEVVECVGKGDHIVYIGRKLAKQHSAVSILEGSLAQQVNHIQSMGGLPIPVERPTGPYVRHLRSRLKRSMDEDMQNVEAGKNGAGNVEAPIVLVFPVGVEQTMQLLKTEPLQSGVHAVARERDEWVAIRPLRADHNDENATYSTGKVAKLFASANLRLIRSSAGDASFRRRRSQAWTDKRGLTLANALARATDFPYRLPGYVEGRILLATGSLEGGGAERQLVNTAVGLKARGHDDVHILAEHLRLVGEREFYFERASKAAASISSSPDFFGQVWEWSNLLKEFTDVLSDDTISRVMAAASVIARVAPETVSISLDWPGVTVGLAAVLAGVPHIFISGRNVAPIHFNFFQWFMLPVFQALANCPRVHFLNNSEAGRNSYADWLRIAPDRIRVLRNGFDHTSFMPSVAVAHGLREQLGIGMNDKVVCGAFRLSAEKRPMLWIDTAVAIHKSMPEAVFLLCGVGDMRADIEQRLHDEKLGSYIRLLGQRADLHDIISVSDVVLITSLVEGTPNVLIEAQAVGVPVVTTPAAAAKEAVNHGVTGLVVDKETARCLASATTSILNSIAFRDSAKRNGPAFIEEKFGFERMIDDTLEAFADAGMTSVIPLMSKARWQRHPIALFPIAEEGHCSIVEIPSLAPISDNMESPEKSTVVVLEEGIPLGPAHSAHDVVRRVGHGAFSHWQNTIFISSSDGSSVPENGRQYLAVESAFANVRCPRELTNVRRWWLEVGQRRSQGA